MNSLDLTVAFFLSMAFARISLPYWIARAKEHGLLLTDVQKVPPRKIPHLAGLTVIFSATAGILFYIAEQTFLYKNETLTVVLLAAVASILIALIIGVVDDLLGEKIGLRQYQKPILTLLAALPIVVVNAGQNVMGIPFFGKVTLGNFYPFLIVPFGIIGAANGFNMLAGANGLEAGMGIIALTTLGIIALKTGETAAAVIALCAVAALLVFFWYNKYPAKILPGNGLTYAVGTTIAVVAIVGNMERAAILLFIPYFFEFFLKLRGKFKKESLAKPLPDGSIVSQYDKWYSLNHVAISALRKVKKQAREWEMVLLIHAVEIVVALGTLALYFT